jgi:hypothetical protein
MITRHEVAQKVIDYLQHRLALVELVDWAERALMEGDLDERDLEVLRDSLARLGWLTSKHLVLAGKSVSSSSRA